MLLSVRYWTRALQFQLFDPTTRISYVSTPTTDYDCPLPVIADSCAKLVSHADSGARSSLEQAGGAALFDSTDCLEMYACAYCLNCSTLTNWLCADFSVTRDWLCCL